ncbi:Abi family protein [Lachnospiraceae bacterium LCP19S3_B12]
MDNLYNFTTVDQQIQKLKSQQLSFENEGKAKTILRTYGYYNIINGYRDPYIIRDYGRKLYNPGITFEQIFALFSLDHHIRDSVLLAMIDFEEHLRAVVADILSESFGSDFNNYLAKNNFRDKKVSDPRFNRESILNNLLKVARNSRAQPIKYYRETHSVIPPWILLKGVFFSDLVNLTKFFKKKERDKLINRVYPNNLQGFSEDTLKDLLSDTLFMLLEYRNLAAHGGRVYNYVPKSTIRELNARNIRKGLPQLLSVLSFFVYQQPFHRLENTILQALNEYCSSYINDIERLKQATGLEIYTEKRVWINENSNKYHSIRNCSGSKNNKFVLLEEAENLGFAPCKRCCK